MDMSQQAWAYLKENRDLIISDTADICFSDHPDKKSGTGDWVVYCQGLKYHLMYLSEALYFDTPGLFINGIKWGRVFLASTGIDEDDIERVLEALSDKVKKDFPECIKKEVLEYLDMGIKGSRDASGEDVSFINEKKDLGKECSRYISLLLDNNKAAASNLVMDLAIRGIDIKDIYLKIFQPAQNELGRLWQTGRISVAQEHYSTATTQLIMSQLYSYIFNTEKNDKVFVGACVNGELHEIGIRMVSDLLELEGWNTFYLGANVPMESIEKTVIEHNPDIVGLSASMTFHVKKAAGIIETIKNAETKKKPAIIVGGYAFNSVGKLWKNVGADLHAADAGKAVEMINGYIDA
jgi:MerR family transcriptional regulator, light-induced transcriptional regulator